MTALPDSTRPDVAIVVPVFDDEAWVETALRSCTAQTLANIEIIVVDDASRDNTAAIVERYASIDPRVTLVRHDTNRTAFEARRTGVLSASAPRILFLDGDDELVPEAALSALTTARETGADVVGFGCVVVAHDGSTGGRYEHEMQPTFKQLEGEDIVASLFPTAKVAQGQLWRYLFNRVLLVAAFDMLPAEVRAPRVNDLPLAFLTLAIAQKYAATSERLYRYHFRRGASGHRIATIEDYLFNASAIDSIDVIATAVEELAVAAESGDGLRALYRSVRLSVIGRVLHYIVGIEADDIRSRSLDLLTKRVGWSDLVAACGDFCPPALPYIARSVSPPPGVQAPRHIMLRTGNLRTGGVQGVVVAQAQHLLAAGFRVTIAVDSPGGINFDIPDEIPVRVIEGRALSERLSSFTALCDSLSIDVVIDHHVFYNDVWPYFAIAAGALGVRTIAWIHNFALRPLLDGNDRIPFLREYLPLLSNVVVLSMADVAFWQSQGLERVVYLPNPPSPLSKLLPSLREDRALRQGRLEIAWWGRLQRATKQVDELIRIAGELERQGVDFRLTIIGPDSPDLSADDLRRLAKDEAVEHRIRLTGALHGRDLMNKISASHVFLATSIIEGYPLVLVEAQMAGLPVVMYDLPWLAVLDANEGIISVPQRDRRAAAAALARMASDSGEYSRRSMASVAAASRIGEFDLEEAYSALLEGRLVTPLSDGERVKLMALLLDRSLFFAELLVGREKRALRRARAEASNRKRESPRRGRAEGNTPTPRATLGRAQMPPSIRSGGFKGWLQSFLPATMRQTSYYARHNHSAGWVQHNDVLSELELLASRLDRIDSSLSSLDRRVRRTELSRAAEAVTGPVPTSPLGAPTNSRPDAGAAKLDAHSLGSPHGPRSVDVVVKAEDLRAVRPDLEALGD